MKIRIRLFLLLLAGGLTAYGQTDFRPGYYITLDQDTIYGQIDYRGDVKNMEQCVFRASRDAGPTELSPGEILGYRFTRGKYYVSKQIESEEGPSWVFLEYLVNGIKDLYYYRDSRTDKYLLESDAGRMFDLTNEPILVKVGEKSYLKDVNKHVGLLKANFSDCGEIQPDLEKATLTHNSLIKLTSRYHGYVCSGEECIIYEKDIPYTEFRLAFLAGAGRSSLEISYPVTREVVFAPVIAPVGGVQLHIRFPRINEKLSLQTEALFLNNHFHFTGTKELLASRVDMEADFETTYLAKSLGIKYTYPGGRINPSIAAGGAVSVLLGKKTLYSETTEMYTGPVSTNTWDDIPVTGLLRGWFVQAGVEVPLQKRVVFGSFRYLSSYGTDVRFNQTGHRTTSLVLGIYL